MIKMMMMMIYDNDAYNEDIDNKQHRKIQLPKTSDIRHVQSLVENL